MNKIVTRINWVNDTDPAINDTHLNQMDSELDAIDNRVIAMETGVITQAENAEAWANGTRGGEAIGPSDPAYHKDAKYQAAQAASSASDAATSETNAGLSAVAAADSESHAAADALVSEGYAKGTQNGVPVGPGSPYHENNAEYFKNQASAIVGPKVTSFNGRENIVLPTKGDYDAAKIEFDPSTTSLPITLDTLQDFLEYAYPPIITVTLTLNGAKEDSITIYDSNNVQVGSCVFESEQTSGQAVITVPSGGGSYKFVSAISLFEVTKVLTDQATQTVNVYRDRAFYWYGNFINSTPFWNADNNDINKNATPPNGSITINTNDVVCLGPQRWRGVISSTPMVGSTVKALITASNFAGDGMVAVISNANDTTANTWTRRTTINAAQTDYTLSGSFDSNEYAIIAQYNATLTLKAAWVE